MSDGTPESRLVQDFTRVDASTALNWSHCRPLGGRVTRCRGAMRGQPVSHASAPRGGHLCARRPDGGSRKCRSCDGSLVRLTRVARYTGCAGLAFILLYTNQPPMRSTMLPEPSTTRKPSALPSVCSAGSRSAAVTLRASSTIALKTRGAKMAMHIRSQMKVPQRLMKTRPITWKRNASLGKGSRWMRLLISGNTDQESAAHPTTVAPTERKRAWFSVIPRIHGRPL
mmetsp:Transcript_5718/g.14636  ORF Transcript_5718/g.14636 Transcript_5718/m.14636 type:complete len:227 (+) Transcript_5718:89-769(+)